MKAMEINKDVDSEGEEERRVGGVDLYRDTFVRYVGYANEVGEALRPVYPKVVRPSYGMAFGYVVADTLDKVGKKRADQAPMEDVVRSGVDCLLWQTLASVLIPGKVINVVTAGSAKALAKSSAAPLLKKWGPTVVGLATIPLIIHPIDTAVDCLFDNTLRRWWK